MQLMPMGDYYIWYCEWCDSRNRTLWTRIEERDVSCGACHLPLSIHTMAGHSTLL
ncbi:MAG: hypothetical protein HYS23_05940 [Geobacter sp.]|nr:hypothetical protein [Geobacter sp.]